LSNSDFWYNLAVTKVAIIIERLDINLGGAERSVVELASALSQSGLDVHVLAANGFASEPKFHILCPSSPGKRTGYFKFVKALKRYLAENHYDIVHSTLPVGFADLYQPRGGSYAESIVRNAASYQRRSIEFFKRTTAFANYRRTLLLCAERRLCGDPEGPLVAALSSYVAEQFKKHYGLDDRRIVIIRNGIKTFRRADPAQVEALRDQLLVRSGTGSVKKPVFFLFAANNFRLKGLAPLINAMALVKRRSTARPAYLVVVGSDSAARYRRLARRLNLEEKVIFLGPVRNIQTVLAVCDVAVLPTFYDPASRFILEALVAEKPVITTRFNGATDFFVHDRHGKILETPDDIESLAQSIAYFTDTANLNGASAAICEDNLKEKIDIRRSVEELVGVYTDLLERKQK